MSNIDETAKAIMLNSMKEVFTYSEIEEEVIEETPAEKLRREIAEAIVADRQKREEEVSEKKLYKSGDATTSDEKSETIKEKKVKNTIKINPTIEEEIAKLAEETPAERIDRISKSNVAQQAAKAQAKRDASTASAKKFQAHKKEVLSKGGRPVDALDSWHKKKASEEVEVDEAKVDDVKYGKGKGWDQPDGKSMTKYSARHSYLKKNPPNVRSDRNKRHSAVDVVFHGHDKVERDRKAKHHASKGVKKVKGAKVATGGKEALKKRFQDQGAMEATDYHRGQGEKIQKRTLEWMKKRGEKGAPGLDAMKARSAEHKAKRSVKEAYRVLAKSGSDKGKPSQFSYKDEKDAKKFADSIKKDGGRATVTKEDTVQELNRYEKETGKSSGSLNMPKGRPTQTGGTKDPVMRAVRTSIRKETGKPEGQHKKERGKKPPVAGEYGARRTPKDIVLNRRAAKARADAAMMDTRGT